MWFCPLLENQGSILCSNKVKTLINDPNLILDL